MMVQPTYFQDFAALKLEMNNLGIPPNATIFTYDVNSIYTKIGTKNISAWLSAILYKSESMLQFNTQQLKHINCCHQDSDDK